MASITFNLPNGTPISNTSGSGIGFFGPAGFGASVLVGAYQDNTFITDGNGVNQGAIASNIKYLGATSGMITTIGSGYPVINIPNINSTLNINFSNSAAVRVQNAYARIYDRVNILNGASGVTTQYYECIHVSPLATLAGSGANSWTQINAGVSTGILMANSPGPNGNNAGNGSVPLANAVAATSHDWYLCLSASPNSIGSKTQYGLYISLEYL